MSGAKTAQHEEMSGAKTAQHEEMSETMSPVCVKESLEKTPVSDKYLSEINSTACDEMSGVMKSTLCGEQFSKENANKYEEQLSDMLPTCKEEGVKKSACGEELLAQKAAAHDEELLEKLSSAYYEDLSAKTSTDDDEDLSEMISSACNVDLSGERSYVCDEEVLVPVPVSQKQEVSKDQEKTLKDDDDDDDDDDGWFGPRTLFFFPIDYFKAVRKDVC
ncbi:uncharacterized protein LOC134241165 isoform X2 [Saccostrea cucullata]|uniref:uncharacterized protein LOC134241165 isoform X2 n=1 Tax=Saccostrea cuccullata TaxID=36930 RepID=UPI002ED179E3